MNPKKWSFETKLYIIIAIFTLIFTGVLYQSLRSSSDVTFSGQTATVPDGGRLALAEFRAYLWVVPNGNTVTLSAAYNIFKEEIKICDPKCKKTIDPGRGFPILEVEKISGGIKVTWSSKWLKPAK
ncbi:MAG: hypothetical protein UW41_C0011G0011 [Candidatus Collierbacteria bacterium GW2011_GWC2_44_18]|uniref:Uncharacterized protein n=2 Tax=Microgenomates group TaxID=1794810 RepID=A0A0G1J595_9BACT|nr:MAG: hypothetical protein UW16_C0023G0010 [Microgenomates group bacterium GW2011_GWC1_44_10]KKT49129.1 MAG: hypothetical protein UW41_C0011G0011 [Candidatus Collierbacteria bacterium GW2011_GWC2_44_18]KKT66806.1 MAG: hypothetical protein UW60_C0018G0004 [Candidatus Woesebacteria bacterium GW2011_GWA2_44_33]